MVNISNFIAKNKVIEVEYPNIPEWKIQLAFVPREDLTKILNQSQVIKFSKITHQREEQVDNDRFLKLYSEKVVKGWSGFKLKHLSQLVVVEGDITGKENEDIEFTPENAHALLLNSVEFDRFISDTLRNVEEFNSNLKSTTVKN